MLITKGVKCWRWWQPLVPVWSLSPDSGSQITAAAPRVEKELLQRYPQLRKPEKSHKIYFLWKMVPRQINNSHQLMISGCEKPFLLIWTSSFYVFCCFGQTNNPSKQTNKVIFYSRSPRSNRLLVRQTLIGVDINQGDRITVIRKWK